MEYLYGASVQGIQGFIFQTNKLKEIVGASELVEQICTKEFEKFCGSIGIKTCSENFIIKAAGNIKYIFDSRADCEMVVRSFPKHIANLAPGITISQAVVTVSEKLNKDISDLELKLKAQRSKVSMPIETGFMGLERSRRTGGVASIERSKIKGGKEMICDATDVKRKNGDPNYQLKNKELKETLFQKISGLSKVDPDQVPYNIEKIAISGNNNWLAVIHADGNALGLLLQELGAKLHLESKEKVKSAFSTFSKNLDEATKAAAQFAFKKMVDDKYCQTYPLRPVILGGDDLTIIIRADLALEFTVAFLKKFEEETKHQFSFLKTEYQVDGFENGITACAGIAYIKATYPFHYAVNLAEKLTAKAKKFSKKDNQLSKIPPSSLAFYKVQSSFVEDMDDIIEKTLTAKVSNVSFDYGPYYIDRLNGTPCIDELNNKLQTLEKHVELDQSKGISKLRQWISELYKDKARADFMMERMEQVEGEKGLFKKLDLHNALEPISEQPSNPQNERASAMQPTQKTIVYDLIQLHSLKY